MRKHTYLNIAVTELVVVGLQFQLVLLHGGQLVLGIRLNVRLFQFMAHCPYQVVLTLQQLCAHGRS